MFFNRYPYTDFHELNLDWILKEISSLKTAMADFEVANKLDFRGEWDPAIIYPQYSLVVYDDIGYVAIKAVPKNVAITDDAYWVSIGSFAVATDLSDRVTALETALAEAEDDISAVSSDVAAVASDVETLTASVTDRAHDLGVVTPGHNIVFFGDSWTVGSGASDSTKRFSTLLANKLRLTEFNYGVGASGFTRTGNLIQTQIANCPMTEEQIANTNYVVVTGGVNDIRHYDETTMTDFAAAIVDTANMVYSKFPNANVVFAICNTVKSGIDDTRKFWMSYAKDILMQANVKNLTICDMRYILYNRTDTYTSDDLHPNDKGHALVAGHIGNAILSSETVVSHYINNSISLSSGSISSGGHLFFYNGIIHFTECQINFDDYITTNTLIGTLDAAVIPKNNIYVPVYHDDIQVGQLAFTANGNIRIIPNTNTTFSSCYVMPFTYTA